MNPSTRREFLQSTAGLIALGLAGSAFSPFKSKPLLSFTTLGCPDWTFPEIVKFATANHFSGLEIRGILRELDLPKCKEFNSATSIQATQKLMKDNGLKFSGLGASTSLHHKEGADRQKNLDEAKRFIDLANQLGCSAVRVFPNIFPKDQEKQATMELIAKGLIELGNYANGGNVRVLLETHGDLIHSSDVDSVMSMVSHDHVGLVWDIVNMWSETKEPVAEVYAKLKKHIFHTHIKDEKTVDGKIKYVLMGQGESPIFEAVDILTKGGYTGYYSFEWEKLWHPEIEGPEIALAQYAKVMAEHFTK